MKIDWETVSQWRHYWVGWADFAYVLIQKMCCHGNINSPILLKFGTQIQLSICNKITNFVKIDWEMTSQWRHYCFGGLNLSEVPLQESVAIATAKDLHSNFYLLNNSYIFSGKITDLVELSFSLSELRAKNLKSGAKHPPPPGRIGLRQIILQIEIILYLSVLLKPQGHLYLLWEE